MTPIAEHTSIEVAGGLGVLSFDGQAVHRGSQVELCETLLVQNDPIATLWDEQDGSTLTHLAFHSEIPDVVPAIDALQRSTAEGLRDGVHWVEQFWQYLSLFPSGTHWVSLFKDEKPIRVFPFESVFSAEGIYGHPYRNLISTLPDDALDPSRVRHYRGQILAGVEPVVLTASASDSEDFCFVIDGHHKLAAYQGLKPPTDEIRGVPTINIYVRQSSDVPLAELSEQYHRTHSLLRSDDAKVAFRKHYRTKTNRLLARSPVASARSGQFVSYPEFEVRPDGLSRLRDSPSRGEWVATTDMK